VGNIRAIVEKDPTHASHTLDAVRVFALNSMQIRNTISGAYTGILYSESQLSVSNIRGGRQRCHATHLHNAFEYLEAVAGGAVQHHGQGSPGGPAGGLLQHLVHELEQAAAGQRDLAGLELERLEGREGRRT
jgi:hypothetical protein